MYVEIKKGKGRQNKKWGWMASQMRKMEVSEEDAGVKWYSSV